MSDNHTYENAPWNQSFEEEVVISNASENEKYFTEDSIKNNEIKNIDENTLAMFFQTFSGVNQNGESKVTITYQTYATEEPEDSIDKERIYATSRPSVEFSYDKKYPQFFMIDIIYKSYDDPELKMLWGRLQKFKRNMTAFPEKTWIFYFNILENASVTMQTEIRDELYTVGIFNPTLFYLSREVPNYLSDDVVAQNGELYGGNMIRMLVPVEFVTFEISKDIDTSLIKGEVMREESDKYYTDNPDNHSKWEE